MRTGRMVAAGIGVLAAGTLAASPAAAGSSAGTQHFLVVNTSTADTPPPAPVAATGPIDAHGRDVVLTNNKDRFVFPKGAVIVVHKVTKMSQSQDPGSCSASFTQQGTYTVVSGTGAYAKAHGSGTFTVTGFFIGCGKTPAAASVIIKASGPLSL
jgi:hypothetical protein